MEDKRELQQIADELRSIAAFGLNFSQNPNDDARYQAVLSASARLSALISGESSSEILRQFQDNAFQLSALPSAEAVVVQNSQLLLIQRNDDSLWALPGGITDPGETLAESAQRELWEEAGIYGRVRQLLGIFDSRLWHSEKRIHFYHAVFLIEAAHKKPDPGPEVLGARYFAEDELPSLSPGHHLRVPFIFKQLRGEMPIPFFDPVTESAGQNPHES
jgi:8-oxo-dGTP pyrophosphatase MutT (NUDIX family)